MPLAAGQQGPIVIDRDPTDEEEQNEKFGETPPNPPIDPTHIPLPPMPIPPIPEFDHGIEPAEIKQLSHTSWLDCCPMCFMLLILCLLLGNPIARFFRWLRGSAEDDIKEQDTPKSGSNVFETEKYESAGACPKCGRQLFKTPAGNWVCMNC